MTTLPDYHVRLAVADCRRDPKPERRTLAATIARLPRERESVVVAAYDAALFGDIDRDTPIERGHGRLAERMRELHRPLVAVDREGMTISAIAAQAGMDRDTLVSLLDHHGYIELVPYGGRQRRHLVTDAALNAGMGHNVDPSARRSRRLDGLGKTAPFPVFYSEALSAILWTLDFVGVSRSIAEMPTKRLRLAFAMRQHSHLPNAELASLCGCSLSAVEKSRRRAAPGLSSAIITHDRTFAVKASRRGTELGADSLRGFALMLCERARRGLLLTA